MKTPHIVVCIKSVRVRPPKKKAGPTLDALVLNPFDRPALEMALALKAETGARVTALSMGPKEACSALCEALAMGLDRAVLVCDNALAGSDTLATATALSAAIQTLAPLDLVVFGVRSADGDTGHIGPQTAAALAFPLVTGIDQVTFSNGMLEVARNLDGFRETFEMDLPGAVTVHPAAFAPRDVGLLGVEDAFSKGRVQTFCLSDIGLSAHQVGESGSPTRVFSVSRIQRDRKCEFLSGNVSEQVEALMDRLVQSGVLEP
jgi:electron transfer flavoprotein beta subunit